MSPERSVLAGLQRFDGVVFLPAAPAAPGVHRVHATGRADVTHVSTDDLARTAYIRRALIEQIASANRKVLFCSFLFADEEIVRALCAAAERLHGGVYVLTALGKHLRAEILEPDSDVDANTAKLQERARRHEDHLQRLAHAGVWLRSAEDCHAKFCVLDDESAVVTSANATQEAYESNPEDGLVVQHAPAARELGRLFAYVWQHLATLESTPGARLDVHSLTGKRPPGWRPLVDCGGVDPVATLRKEEGSLQRAAIEVIDRAKTRLVIASYSLMGMESHPIGEALQRSVERGVELDLLLQPRNHVSAQRVTCAWLVGLAPDRVRLHGHRRTHTKSIVADGQLALIWTGNLEAAHGWDNGIEVGLRVDDPGVASAIASWTSDVMHRATHIALASPTVRELVEHGQTRALTGEWTLNLPVGVSPERVGAAFEKHPLELLELSGGLALRCADEMLMDVTLAEVGRRIDGLRTRRVEGLMGSRSRGWVSDCTLRLVAAPEPPSVQNQQPTQQQYRGKKGRRR